MSRGDTSCHDAPSSSVRWMTPLFVPAQMTPSRTGEIENDVIDDAFRCARGARRSVRSGLISRHETPPSVVFSMNCVP
jgi:hypothetical protein